MIEILLQRSLKYSVMNALRARTKFESIVKRTRKLEEYYFAYGANLSEARLRSKHLAVELVGTASAEGFEVRFNVPCEYSGQGFAGLASQADGRAEGVLFRTDSASLLLLDIMEWVPFHFYRRKRISVTSGGQVFEAWAYVPCHPRDGLKPSKGYLKFVQSSAAAHGFQVGDVATIENPKIDHEFNLWNPGRTRFSHRYIHQMDKLREQLAARLP